MPFRIRRFWPISIVRVLQLCHNFLNRRSKCHISLQRLEEERSFFIGTAGVPPALSALARTRSYLVFQPAFYIQPLHWDRGRPARTERRRREQVFLQQLEFTEPFI